MHRLGNSERFDTFI